MPQETINNMTPLEYEMRWKVADYQHSTIYRCEVVKPNSKWRTNPAWSGTVTALKRDLTAADFKGKPEHGTNGDFVVEGEPYAGESFEGDETGKVHTADNWRCGKYLISYTVYDESNLKPLQNESQSYPLHEYYNHYDFNSIRFMKANVEQLCGTKTNPTKAVTDYPYITWHSYRNSQATNPETYGMKKPADLKHIDFSPRKKASPTMTKKSPTSTNTSTP